MEEALRLTKLPTYVFSALDKLKAEERAKGQDLIDCSIGSPNVPPPQEVIDAMKKALDNPETHRYPTFDGLPEFNQAVANWCNKRYHNNIDPKNEVVPLIGSKEGIVHLAFAYLNPGDNVLVTEPAYPAHFRGPILAGANPVVLPTNHRTGFLPDLDNVDDHIAKQAKMLILSYPTNPTAATAPLSLLEKAVKFCKKYNLIFVHDFAYAELYFEGKKPPSALSIPGAKDVTIEFHSLSKTFGMAGWRCGFAVGNHKIIDGLKAMKTNLDYGLFLATQRAAVTALQIDEAYLDNMRAIYQNRRDFMVEGLNKLGWSIEKPMATMYLWFPVPKGYNSHTFVLDVIKKTGVVLSPGTAFGAMGEGYVRLSLVQSDERLREALARLEKANIRYQG
jgi:LL-diaminopimelate aminotransferase